jgi:hypothetical protein
MIYKPQFVSFVSPICACVKAWYMNCVGLIQSRTGRFQDNYARILIHVAKYQGVGLREVIARLGRGSTHPGGSWRLREILESSGVFLTGLRSTLDHSRSGRSAGCGGNRVGARH